MGVFKRSKGVYELTVRRKGYSVRRTFTTLGDAKAAEADEIKAIDSGLKGSVSTYAHFAPLVVGAEGERLDGPETVRMLLTKYLTECTERKKGAVREKSRVWKLIGDELADKPIISVDAGDIARYIERRRGTGISDATVRLEVMLLSAVFRTARKKWGIKVSNPVNTDDIELPQGSRERVRRLKPGEYRKLLTALRNTCRNAGFAEAVRFAVRTAMRQGEILGLRSSMVDKNSCVISLPDSKTGRRDIPISESAVRILNRCPGDVPFPISADRLSRAFREACDVSGIADLHFHDLRHEAISRFFERGLDITEVAMISGHRTLSVLMRYTHHRATRIALKLKPKTVDGFSRPGDNPSGIPRL